MKITLDIETHTNHRTIWCCGVEYEDGTKEMHYAPDTLQSVIDEGYEVIGHNIIGFDAPVLKKVWDVDIEPTKLIDTLVMSRLYHPSVEGGHKLSAWGKRLGDNKGDFTDFDGGLCQDMIDYCHKDVALTFKLYHHLVAELKKSKFSDESVQLEHEVALIIQEQRDNGFKLDIDRATQMYMDFERRLSTIEAELQLMFPAIVTERWSDKTGKRLMDGVEHFNVGSRPQIAKRLQSVGVVFTEFTDKGAVKINEEVLERVAKQRPEAAVIFEYLVLTMRATMVKSWLAHCKEGRVHGNISTNGAITGRMTHSSPNMGAVPKVLYDDHDVVMKGLTGGYGFESRSCWIVKEGHKLVGMDASGLELRMLAHYMQDQDYIDELLDGDIHTTNMIAAGLVTRNQAKTFIYGFLYGGGDAKLGDIVGGTKADGKRLKKNFLDGTPALKALRDKIARIAESGSVPALDGRRIRIRHMHAATNSLLQSAGAIVMKKALVLLDKSLKAHGIPYAFVANVHDEFQIEVPDEYVDIVGMAGVRAIKNAGIHYNMRCPLDAEYKVGNNWAETH